MTASSSHSHVTRDIKPEGECPGCDRHYSAKREAEALLSAYPAPEALVADVDAAIARRRAEGGTTAPAGEP